MRGKLAKILAGVGIAFAAVVALSGALIAVYWDQVKVRGQNLVAVFSEEPEYAGGFADREEALQYLASRPGDFSLVSYTVGDEGGVGIEHLPAEPSPLASTKKIVVLAAYAKEVSEGNLDPDEEVPVSEWESHYIPNTDGGAHPAAMEDLEIPADGDGFATDPEATATLDEMAHAMISASDNAATDYLIDRLGQGKLRAVIEGEDLAAQEDVLPISGSFLLWFGPESEGSPSLAEMSREEYGAAATRAAEAYANGEYPEDWRKGNAPVGSLVEQREATARYETRGAAEDYARVLAEVSAGEFISPQASEVMRRHLEWPMEADERQENFEAFGAKGGSLSGVLNHAVYAAPKSGDFSGETRVVVLFTRDMSASAWLGAVQSEGYPDFVDALATDRGFAERVEKEIGAER